MLFLLFLFYIFLFLIFLSLIFLFFPLPLLLLLLFLFLLFKECNIIFKVIVGWVAEIYIGPRFRKVKALIVIKCEVVLSQVTTRPTTKDAGRVEEG